MACSHLSSLVALALAVLGTGAASAQPFVFHLRGDQEVPPVASPASGGCLATFDPGPATLSLTCVHDVVGATVMHIHRGAVVSTARLRSTLATRPARSPPPGPA